LRERLSKVEEWRRRHEEIERELNEVWLEGGKSLPPPPYDHSIDDGTETGMK
jgi:ATP-binding cassette, subfamily D (ALD), peroxisomal long-chain fatty acid import protein